MIKVYKTFILILFIFIVVSCTSRKDHEANLNSWIGAKESVLIETWGTPSTHYKTDDGKKYLTWKNRSQAIIGGSYGYGTSYISPTLVTSNCDITMVLIDGLVSTWNYKGNNCYDY